MQVLLVRHALPLRSEPGEGSDPNLSEEGLAQVKRLPEALARFPISRVVSSPQRRAVQTAEPVAAARQLVIDIDDRFAVQVDGKRAATEPPSREQLGEGAHRAAEAGVCRALYAVRERCAAVPVIDTRHNVLNLPATPANKTGVTNPLSHRTSAASSSCCAASAGVSSPSRSR